MSWRDITIQQDENGEYLAFRERQTKTRTGSAGDVRQIIPKAYQNPGNLRRCPVVLYREYVRHRPDNYKGEDTPFYLAVNYPKDNWDVDKKWYKCAPLGKNTINKSIWEKKKPQCAQNYV